MKRQILFSFFATLILLLTIVLVRPGHDAVKEARYHQPTVTQLSTPLIAGLIQLFSRDNSR